MDTPDRAVLLKYRRAGEERRGSGFRVGDCYVLTADHCAAGEDHLVVVGGREHAAKVVIRTRNELVDIAILVAPTMSPLPYVDCVRLDASCAVTISNCEAVGYPRWKDRPPLSQGNKLATSPYRTAHVTGYINPSEGRDPYAGADLPHLMSFKILGPLPRGSDATGNAKSQWAGMSGSAVIASNKSLVGVVRSHIFAEGEGSLTFTPLSAIDTLPGGERAKIWRLLGVLDGISARSMPPGGVQGELDDLRPVLKDWCVNERERHRRSISQLPYLDRHPDRVGNHIAPFTQLGIRSSDRRRPTEEVAFSEAVSEHRQLVILADAGMGKTWLLHQHAIALTERAISDIDSGVALDRIAIPIAVRADAIADACRPGDTFADVIVRTLQVSKPLDSWIRTVASSGAPVVLIDALDETTPEQLATTTKLLTPPDNPSARYVITSRLSAYSGILDPEWRTEAELMPFNFYAQMQYIRDWNLDPERQRALFDRLGSHRSLADMARVPLLLAFLCRLAHDSGEPFPENRAELYERVTRRFLLAHQRPSWATTQAAAQSPLSADPNVRADELMEILRPLTYAIATDADGWLDSVPRGKLLNCLTKLKLPRGMSPAQALALLANESGVLAPAGDPTQGRTPPYRYIHRTIAEYLVAEHIANNSKLADDTVRTHLHLSHDWRQTWLLAAQLAPGTVLSALANDSNDVLYQSLEISAEALKELTPEQRVRATESIDKLERTALGLLEQPTCISFVKQIAVTALQETRGPGVVKALTAAVVNAATDADTRTRSIIALGRLGDRLAADVLASYLDSPSYGSHAAIALARIGGPRALGLLRRVVADESSVPGVCETAIRALKSISNPNQPRHHVRIPFSRYSPIADFRSDKRAMIIRSNAINAMNEIRRMLRFIPSPADASQSADGLLDGSRDLYEKWAKADLSVRYGTGQAVDPVEDLREIMSDHRMHGKCRFQAANVLGQCMDQTSLEILLSTDSADRGSRALLREAYLFGCVRSARDWQVFHDVDAMLEIVHSMYLSSHTEFFVGSIEIAFRFLANLTIPPGRRALNATDWLWELTESARKVPHLYCRGIRGRPGGQPSGTAWYEPGPRGFVVGDEDRYQFYW